MNREALDRILKKMENVPQAKQSYAVRDEDGNNIGNVTYWGKKAIESNRLDSYTPQNEEEAQTLSIYQKYLEQIQSTPKSSNSVLDKYGIDPDNFSYADFQKWAVSHNFEPAKTQGIPRLDKETGKPSDVYGPGTYWFPKRTWAFGKKLTSEEDEQALAQLRALAEKNERKSAMSQKSSPVVTAVEGFADAITFGLSDALNDRKDQKLVSQLGEEYISRQDAKKKNAQEHPAANIVGAVSGSLIPFSGISGAVSTATKGIKWFSKMPRWVQSAFNSGITFSIIGGAETAVSGGEPKDIIKSAGINLLGGSAGGAAGSVVGKIGEKFLFNKQLQHKVIPEIIRNGLSASAFSGAKTASTYWLYPEESRPEKEDIAKDILSAFAIASISSYVDVLSASKQSKKTLNDLNQKMAADYEQMARESVSGEKGTQGSRKFAKNVLEYNKQIEAFLTGKGYEGTVDGKRYSFEPNKIRLVGQNKQVSQILENLQTIQNRANAVLNGMPSAGTDIAVRSEAAVSAATPAETSVVPAVSTGAAVKAAEAVRTQVQSVNRQGNTQISAVPVQSVQNDGQVQNNAAITPKRQNIQEPSPTINRAEPNEDSHIEFSPQEKTALAKGLSSKRAKGVTLEQAEADIRAVTAKAKQQIERLVNPDGAVTADGAKLRRANTEFLSRPDALIDESFIRLYAETFADALDQSGNRIFKAAKQQNGDIAADIAGYAMTGTLRGTYDQQTGSAVKIYGKDFRKALQSAGQAAYSAKIRLYQETPVMSGQISALQDGKLRRVVQLSAAQRDGALYYQRYLDGDTEEIHGITAVEGKGGAVVAFGENASRLADLTGTEPVTMVFGDEAVSMVRVDKAELIGQADGEASADNGGEPANVSALSIESMSQNEESISHSKRGSDGINRGKLAVSTDRAAQMLKNISEARKQFVEFAKQRFPNVVVNEQTQKEIGISRTGVDKFLSGNISKEKLATGFEIPELLRTATKTGEAPNKKGKTGISGYEYYYNTIQVDGQEYAAYIRVRNTDMGDKYYGHTIGKSLVDIKLEPLAWNSEEKTPVHSINASSSITNSIPQNAATVNPSIRGNGENDTVKKAKTEGVEKAGGNDIIKSSVNETDYGYALSGIPSRTEMERISREAANDGAVVELSGDDGMAGATLVYDDSATPETVRRDILAYYQDGVMPKNAIPDDAAFDDVRFSAERGSDYYKEDENGRKNEEQWQGEAIRRDDAGGDLYTGRTGEDDRIDRSAYDNQEQPDTGRSGRDHAGFEAGISRKISESLKKPLYHGTAAEIDAFSPSYVDIGIHFGTREQAEARVSGIERPRMIQAGLEIKNPLYVREDIFGERMPREYLDGLLEYGALNNEQKRLLSERYDAFEKTDIKTEAKRTLLEKLEKGTHDVAWRLGSDGIEVELYVIDGGGEKHSIPRMELLTYRTVASVLSDSDVDALLSGKAVSANGDREMRKLAINQLTHIEADYLRLRNLEESIQELGYDGLVYPNQNEGEGLSFAVFRDSQIKRTNEKNHDSGGQSDYSLKDSQHEEWGAEKQKNKHVIKTLPEIIQTISDTFGIPITTGNLSNKSASGEYRRRAETIRIRISNSLPTVAHELGHYFEHKYGLRKSRYIDQAMSMADSAFLEQYSKEKRAGEAIAEFVRVYLTDKAQARKEAPDFFAEFQQKLRSGNELSDLDTIASFVNEYMAADFYKRVDAAITNRKQQQSVKHLWSMRDQLKRKAYMELVDSFSPIKDMVDYVRELTGKATGGRKNAYVLATNSRNADAIANYIVSHGMTDMDGNTGIGMSLIDCIKDVDPKQIKVLDRYLVLKHSLEWLEPKDGKKKRVFADDSLQNTDRISREILKIEKKYPEMKEAAENLYQYQKHIMLNFLVKSGGMTMETAQYLWNLYPSYVPFYRAVGSRQSKVKGTFANQMLPIRRARGGGEQILSPLESIIENTHKMVKFALRNRVMQECAASADSVPGFGKLIEKVPPDMVSRTVGVKDYKDAVKERIGEMLGADDQTAVTEIIDEVFGDSVTGFSPAANAKKRIVTVLRGGKAEYYQIHDELLYESLAELAPGQLKGLLKWSQAIMTPMKLLTTSLNPLFSGSNALRDVQTAYYNSSTNNPIRFLLEYVESVKGILTESEDYQQYMALGGGNASELSANRDLMKKELRKIAMKDKGKAARLFHAMLHPVQLVADINDLIESIPRFQEYMNTVKSTGDKQAGIYAADDITTNFKRSGRTGRAVNALIMYNNAAVQGLDRLCRSFTDVPKDEALKRALKYLITGILTAAVLAWWNHENDEDGYENLSAYMKNNFYVVSLGDGKFVKIPKAREHGILSSAVERLADLSFGDKKAFYDFGGYLADQVIPPMLPSDFNGLPDALHSVLGSTVAGPFIDIGFNEDFKGTPIVSRSMENLPKQMQYNERTSMTAYWLGKVLHQSPLEIDHVISNATGVIGKANKSLLPMETGQRDLTIGMRGRFVADSNYSTDIIDRAYNIADEAEAAYKLEPTAENALNYEKRAVLTSFISKTNNLIKSLPEDEKRKARQRMLSKIKEWEVEMTPQDDRLVSTLGKDEKGELGFIMQSAPDSKLSYTKNKVQHSYTLTPEQYESFVEDIQNAVSKARAETMNMDDFKNASRDKKVDMLKSAQSKAMSDVRETHKKKYMGK